MTRRGRVKYCACGSPISGSLTPLGVTRVALSRVLNGWAGISADMDLRLSKTLGSTPDSWNAMQVNDEMSQARRRFRAKVQRIATSQAGSGGSEPHAENNCSILSVCAR